MNITLNDELSKILELKSIETGIEPDIIVNNILNKSLSNLSRGFERKKIAKEFAEKINSEFITEIILYGSVARGDDRQDSDIDILIISNHKDMIEDLIRDEVFEVVLTKNEVISPLIMDEDKLDRIKDFSFMRNVRQDGVTLA